MASQGRVRTVPTAIRVALVGGLVGSLLVIGLISRQTGPWRERPPTSPEPLDLDDVEFDEPDPPEFDPPEEPETEAPNSDWDVAWMKWVLIVLGVLVILALLYFGLQTLQQRKADRAEKRQIDQRPESALAPAPIIAASGDGVFNARIAADDVISAWQQVEEAAWSSGTPRLAQHTATEFIEVLAARVPIHPEAAHTLLRAYQHARFDHSALTPDEVSVAVTCADRVVADLRGQIGRFAGFDGAGGLATRTHRSGEPE